MPKPTLRARWNFWRLKMATLRRVARELDKATRMSVRIASDCDVLNDPPHMSTLGATSIVIVLNGAPPDA